MTTKQINQNMSAEDLNKFITATLVDAKTLIIQNCIEQLKMEKKLTPAKAKNAIWMSTHAACDFVEQQVFDFLGTEEESKRSEETANFLFILKEWVIKRCNSALSDKSAKNNFSLELACAIVEKIATVTLEELDKYFEEYIEQEEKAHAEMNARMDAYFKAEEEQMQKEHEEGEIKAFGRILTQDERAEKEREFVEVIKATRARVKAKKLERKYIGKDMDDQARFMYFLKETAKILHEELGENPMAFLADVNQCKTPEASRKRIADYVKWVEVAA